MQRDVAQTDAAAVLAGDHQRLRSLFEEFERLPPTAYVRQSKVTAQMIDLVIVHAFIAREVLYPRLRSLIPDVGDQLDGLHEQHDRAEEIAAELWTMRPDHDRFAEIVRALIAHSRLHLATQADLWFSRIRGEVDSSTLRALGAELVRARRRAPASPRARG